MIHIIPRPDYLKVHGFKVSLRKTITSVFHPNFSNLIAITCKSLEICKNIQMWQQLCNLIGSQLAQLINLAIFRMEDLLTIVVIAINQELPTVAIYNNKIQLYLYHSA